jgi:hypothetical protein
MRTRQHSAAQNGRMDAALGFKARTGRAIAVAIGGTVGRPVLLARMEMALLPEGAMAPYHAAQELEGARSRAKHVADSIATAQRMAAHGIREAAAALARDGHRVLRCGVLVGPALPSWSTEDILAVHVRMHQAEGVLFREAIVAGATTCGFELVPLREKSALEDAANALRMTAGDLAACLQALGRSAGPPWGQHQKEAAAAALAALARVSAAPRPPATPR